MQSVFGRDIFDAIGIADALCITTNGHVTRHGECVMGRGSAKQALTRWPGINRILANKINSSGNIVHILGSVKSTAILSFPVKPQSIVFDGSNAVRHMGSRFKVGDTVPGWAAKADINIIEKSCQRLVQLTNNASWKRVAMVAPGCGAGELSYSQIEPILRNYFDDRFWVFRR